MSVSYNERNNIFPKIFSNMFSVENCWLEPKIASFCFYQYFICSVTPSGITSFLCNLHIFRIEFCSLNRKAILVTPRWAGKTKQHGRQTISPGLRYNFNFLQSFWLELGFHILGSFWRISEMLVGRRWQCWIKADAGNSTSDARYVLIAIAYVFE